MASQFSNLSTDTCIGIIHRSLVGRDGTDDAKIALEILGARAHGTGSQAAPNQPGVPGSSRDPVTPGNHLKLLHFCLAETLINVLTLYGIAKKQNGEDPGVLDFLNGVNMAFASIALIKDPERGMREIQGILSRSQANLTDALRFSMKQLDLMLEGADYQRQSLAAVFKMVQEGDAGVTFFLQKGLHMAHEAIEPERPPGHPLSFGELFGNLFGPGGPH